MELVKEVKELLRETAKELKGNAWLRQSTSTKLSRAAYRPPFLS